MKNKLRKLISWVVVLVMLASMLSTVLVYAADNFSPPSEQSFLMSIKIKSPPTKMIYKDGEALDLTGMRVSAVYSDDSEEDITDSVSFSLADGTILRCSPEQEQCVYLLMITYLPDGDGFEFITDTWINVFSNPTSIENITDAKFISIKKITGEVWTLTFEVKANYSDGSFKTLVYTINLKGNNANQNGEYVFKGEHDLAGYSLFYDIKGNGSNVKVCSLIK